MSRPLDWWVLDLGSDPTPGDPVVVAGLVRAWDRVADDAQAAERGVRSVAADGAVLSWLGAAGAVFKDAIGDFPAQLGKCKDSYRAGASALRVWAADLDGAQGQADRALAAGRAARADLVAAQASLGVATSSASGASSASARVSELAARYTDTPAPAGVVVPDAGQVRTAVRGAQVAAARVGAAQQLVGAAQSRLDAARRLALDAKELREGRAKVAATRLDAAAQAGIDPNSWWSDLKEIAAQVWDVVITTAKITVAVLGIVALIIGGPIAWVVLAAAVLVMADTIAKYLQGKASGWDLAFAALGLIPGTKGITTVKALSSAFKTGGTLTAGAHVLSAGRTALTGMAQGLRALPRDLKLALDVGRQSWAQARAGVEVMSVPTLGLGAARLTDGPQFLMMVTSSRQVTNPISYAQQAGAAVRESVDVFGSLRTAQMVKNPDGSYDVMFRYHRNWDEYQRASADAKATMMTKADIDFPRAPTPRNPANTARFAREHPVGSPTSPHAVKYLDGYSHDVDHITGLQLGGRDDASNMWHLQSGVNRSEGAQTAALLRRTDVEPEAAFNSFVFQDRGRRQVPEVVSMIGHVDRVTGGIALAVR